MSAVGDAGDTVRAGAERVGAGPRRRRRRRRAPAPPAAPAAPAPPAAPAASDHSPIHLRHPHATPAQRDRPVKVLERIYTGDGNLDETLAVRDRDVVLVPRGYQAVSAPPRYAVYYLNVMAGPERTWAIANDPDHEWMLNP